MNKKHAISLLFGLVLLASPVQADRKEPLRA